MFFFSTILKTCMKSPISNYIWLSFLNGVLSSWFVRWRIFPYFTMPRIKSGPESNTLKNRLEWSSTFDEIYIYIYICSRISLVIDSSYLIVYTSLTVVLHHSCLPQSLYYLWNMLFFPKSSFNMISLFQGGNKNKTKHR